MAHINRHRTAVIAILALSVGLRLALAALAPLPGIADSNHYYNLAQSLREGRGFVIDYIWQYHSPPDALTHPIDYWMPLSAVWPALAQMLLGASVWAALVPSVIAGGLVLPLLAYHIAGQLGGRQEAQVFALAATASLPELILNSVRTDTTVTYACFAGGALVALYHARRKPAGFALSGALAGLAYLTRQDGLLLVGVFVLYMLAFRPRRWRYLVLLAAGWLIVTAPWFLRNIAVLGRPMPGGASRTLFMTDFSDQFTYARELTLETYLAWGMDNIVKKWAFEGAAGIKTMYTLPGMVLSAASAIGFGALLARRDRERLRLAALPALMVALLWGFYTFVTPFHSQGGSFKKSYMAVLPFAAALAAVMIWQYVAARGARLALAALVCGMMAVDGLVLIKDDFALGHAYRNFSTEVAEAMREAGDVNGDGEIVVMSVDPFIWDYFDFRALITPADDLDTILRVAARYRADYLFVSTIRSALAPIYRGTQTDPRLVLVQDFPGLSAKLYRANVQTR